MKLYTYDVFSTEQIYISDFLFKPPRLKSTLSLIPNTPQARGCGLSAYEVKSKPQILDPQHHSLRQVPKIESQNGTLPDRVDVITRHNSLHPEAQIADP